MPFGFFDWLRVKTRDAVLEGAEEAGQVLEQGAQAARNPSESVVSLDVRLRAVVTASEADSKAKAAPGIAEASAPKQVERERKTAEEKPQPTQAQGASPKKPPLPKHDGPDRREPQLTKKTEALLDVRRGINESQ